MRENFVALVTERKLIVFIFLVGSFSLFGPFGTYQVLEVWERLVFWSLIMAAIGFFMHVAVSIALASPTMTALPRWLRIGIGAMTAAIPGAAVVVFVFRVMIAPTMGADAFPLLWFQVASIGWVACLFEYREIRQSDAPKLVRTRFHKRLPEGEEHDIVSISMSDHYAEVTTTTGTHLVLVRMADAIDELEGVLGHRIHRSHWVAKAHLDELLTQNKKTFAVLSDGRKLPVSKTYAEAVSSALAA